MAGKKMKHANKQDDENANHRSKLAANPPTSRMKTFTSKLNCVSSRMSEEEAIRNDNPNEPRTWQKDKDNEVNHNTSESVWAVRTSNGTGDDDDIRKCNGIAITKSDLAKTIADDIADFRRRRLEELIAAPFVDDYVPPHQNGPDYIAETENIRCWKIDEPVKLRIGFSGLPAAQPISVVSCLKRVVMQHPTKVALSVQRDEEWIRWSFTKYWADIHTIAKAFIKLGLKRFHGVGILGFNSPEWFISGLGTIFAGGLVAGIYTTNTAAACHYILDHSSSNIVVVENELQLKKIMDIKDSLPHLKAIVQYLGEPTIPGVLSWSDLMELGKSIPDEIVERRIKSLAINQCCTIIYTSGTTGDPKGVMLNHDNLTLSASFIRDNWIHLSSGSSLVSYLPLSHIAAQISDMYVASMTCSEIIFARPDAMKGSLVETLKERKPTYFLGVPRVYEKMCEKVKEAESQMSFVKRFAITWAKGRGYVYTRNHVNGTPFTSYSYNVANRLLLRKIKESLGFKCVDSWFCGAAPVSLHTLKFFLSVNVVILECYGMSECTGPHIMNTNQLYKVGSVGKATVYETRIEKPDEDGHGEILMRGRHIFMGYLEMENKTIESIDEEGWLHTGDIGKFDPDGFLHITGRIKELLITAGGENVAPIPIEERVKEELPIVNNAVLIGDKRKFLSMMLTLKTDIDPDSLMPLDTLTHLSRDWCRSVGSNARTMKDVLQGPDSQIMSAIQEGIDRVNSFAVSNAQRIQKWKVLPHNFSIATEELGPTLKLKRASIVKQYHDVIESFYAVTDS